MLRVYARVPIAGFNASSYYRMLLPATIMGELKLCTPIVDPMDAVLDPEDRWRVMSSSDFVRLYQFHGGGFPGYMTETRSWKPSTNAEGVLQYPPTFVFDTDDDIFNVLPMNTAYQQLGYKDHEGKEMPDGGVISVYDEITEEQKVLYADGVNIDFKRNREELDVWRTSMAMADLVTCTTPRTQEYILREAPGARTHIFPNCMDIREYEPHDIKIVRPADEVRILWQGSSSHYEDLFGIKQALKRVALKYPNAKFVFYGASPRGVRELIPAEQMIQIGWSPYAAHKIRLSAINHDINLCPLTPYIFNQSRSAIKWYESSVINYPAATLAQMTGAYKDEIIEGETGLLWETEEEFETKLCGLIEDSMLRKRLADNAKTWVLENRDPKVHVVKLWEAMLEAKKLREAMPIGKKPKNAKRFSTDKPDVRRGAKHRSGKRSG